MHSLDLSKIKNHNAEGETQGLIFSNYWSRSIQSWVLAGAASFFVVAGGPSHGTTSGFQWPLGMVLRLYCRVRGCQGGPMPGEVVEAA